jgi:hypothetical protein
MFCCQYFWRHSQHGISFIIVRLFGWPLLPAFRWAGSPLEGNGFMAEVSTIPNEIEARARFAIPAKPQRWTGGIPTFAFPTAKLILIICWIVLPVIASEVAFARQTESALINRFVKSIAAGSAIDDLAQPLALDVSEQLKSLAGCKPQNVMLRPNGLDFSVVWTCPAHYKFKAIGTMAKISQGKISAIDVAPLVARGVQVN